MILCLLSWHGYFSSYYLSMNINKLREAELLLSQGNTIGVVCKKIVTQLAILFSFKKVCHPLRGLQNFANILLTKFFSVSCKKYFLKLKYQ